MLDGVLVLDFFLEIFPERRQTNRLKWMSMVNVQLLCDIAQLAIYQTDISTINLYLNIHTLTLHLIFFFFLSILYCLGLILPLLS